MNIFEGARRIAIVIGALGAFGGFAAALQQEPELYYAYRIPFYGASATKINPDYCKEFSNDGYKSLGYSSEDGSKFTVALCFSAARANNGEMLIPYAELNGQILMGAKYSAPVEKYMDAYVASNFKLNQADFDKAKAEYASQRIRKKAYTSGAVVGGLIIYWLIISAIGWIIRGFLGIPNGSDRRVTAISPATRP